MKYSFVTLALLFTVFITSCQKEIDFDIPQNPGNGGDTSTGGIDTTGSGGTDTTGSGETLYYYSATIDGKAYYAEVRDDNGYEAGSALSGGDDVVIGAGIIRTDTIKGPTALGINKGVMHGYLYSTDDAFRAFFAAGDYPYAPEGAEGVSIGWMDENGTEWNTSFGSGDQSGSSFKIISQKDPSTLIGFYLEVTCTFNCKLYDDAGHVKTLSNGKFVGLFGKI